VVVVLDGSVAKNKLIEVNLELRTADPVISAALGSHRDPLVSENFLCSLYFKSYLLYKILILSVFSVDRIRISFAKVSSIRGRGIKNRSKPEASSRSPFSF
jgi:hypothetical protein